MSNPLEEFDISRLLPRMLMVRIVNLGFHHWVFFRVLAGFLKSGRKREGGREGVSK